MEGNDRGNNHLEKGRPTIANGIDNDEELSRDATNEDIHEGNYTKVTKLVWDEYDPSDK